MAMEHSSASFALPDWTVTVHGMRSVPNDLDWVAGPRHRLDISFASRGSLARSKPHGLIGQSFATPGLVRNGKVDVSGSRVITR